MRYFLWNLVSVYSLYITFVHLIYMKLNRRETHQISNVLQCVSYSARTCKNFAFRNVFLTMSSHVQLVNAANITANKFLT
jgi:hypothetical protein